MMASSAEEGKKIVLLVGDGKNLEKFEVDEATARQSYLLGDIIDSCSGMEIPVPNVDGKTLAKVIEYCKKHADAAAMALGDNENAAEREKQMRAWDAAYIDVDPDVLFYLLQAAKFLVIESLLNLACEKATAMIIGKSVEEIRRTFNIKNDFTLEEEAEIRKQFPWAFQ